ncbi:unnamed protein product [Arctia plantaginis]|uniref:MADF domain-containing protein n=1 Tax=Arctia plantaginis TaxID=874455 RepID=A0A8S1BFF9_ARCPL|nr:unnamed protein product [Arctia plantaginis]
MNASPHGDVIAAMRRVAMCARNVVVSPRERERPALYDVQLPEYRNREIKAKCWYDVGSAMFTEWDDLTSKEKKEKGLELMTKWKSLRDQFRKELKLQQCSKSGQAASKRRKYIHYDALLFLKKHTEHALTSSNMLNEDSQDVFEDDDSSVNTTPSVTEPSTSNKKKTLVQMFLESNKEISNVMRESIDIQKNTVQRQYNDERGNEAFFRSMLPLMDKIKEDYLIDARTEIMAVIKKYIPPSHTLEESYSRTSTPTSDDDIAQMLEHFDGI